MLLLIEDQPAWNRCAGNEEKGHPQYLIESILHAVSESGYGYRLILWIKRSQIAAEMCKFSPMKKSHHTVLNKNGLYP